MSIFLPKKSKKSKNDDCPKVTSKKINSNINNDDISNFSKKAKSNKNNNKCANPIFEEWITEWRDDAVARDLQSKHTYNKCLNSLKKYPLPLNSGKECIILEGFGDKICKLIDENLERFLRDGGVLHHETESEHSEQEILIENDSNDASSDSDNDDQILAAIDTNTVSNTNKRDEIAAKYSQLHFSKSSKNDNLISNSQSTKKLNKNNNNSNNSSSSQSTQLSQTQSKKSNKEYLPGFRSGPYALLIALYNNEQDNGLNSFMLKRPLMEEAQKHCDSSFMLNDPNSRYTAWNSMSTLIKKDYVFKENKLPARYSLTSSGRKLAYRLLYGVLTEDTINEEEKEEEESADINGEQEKDKNDDDDNVCIIDSDDQEDRCAFSSSLSSLPSLNSFKNIKSVESNNDNNTNKNLNKKYENIEKDEDDLIEILSDSDDDNCNGDNGELISLDLDEPKKDLIKFEKKTSCSKREINESDDTDGLPDLDIQNNDYCPNYDDYNYNYEYMHDDNQIIDSQCSLAEKFTKSTNLKTSQSAQKLSSSSSLSVETSSKSKSIFKKQKSNIIPVAISENEKENFEEIKLSSNTEKQSTYSYSGPPKTLKTYFSGSYEIILFVDNCEQSHAKRQELLMDELRKAKIKFDSGKLSVGDFAWIARSLTSNASDLSDQIILDFIVERKRMDDFCSSILDGRYKEQKFRLKKCGIQNLIYLIEDFGSMKHMSLPEKSLIQADVNTQLIDGLIVHHSSDPKDTASYLIEMTHYVINYYSQTTLYSSSKEKLDDYYKNDLNNRKRCYFMTLNEFNQFSNKNKPLTVREMFAKCLMKIQGVSQEKALAILNLYPTPAILFRELCKYGDENSRVKLIANIKYGTQQRNIGPAIGKLISQLFFTNSALN